MNYKARTNSRIIAMIILYNFDINKVNDCDNVLEYIKNTNDIEKNNKILDAINRDQLTNDILSENKQEYLDFDYDYLHMLVNGVIEKLDYIDYLISLCLDGYNVDTISYVDRSILRLGTFEMIYVKTPKEVVINEMINISKEYSQIEGFNSQKFDNAVLDKIANGNFKPE